MANYEVGVYPVTFDVDIPEGYNRWTVFFRPLLALPVVFLAGGIPLFSVYNWSGPISGALALLALYAWFAIMFTGRFPSTARDTCMLFLRWGANVHAYVFLQAAAYPPFGDKPYPVHINVNWAQGYNRWTVFFRYFLAIPHIIVLLFLSLAQSIVTFIAWFAIMFTGRYPEGLFTFSVGVSRWAMRVTAYLFLFVDEYPPFSLSA
jgi:Domain of unknown function (DUF4389)